MSALTDFFDVILKGESRTYDDHNYYVTNSKLKGYVRDSYGTRYSSLKKELSSDTTLGQLKQYQSRGRDNTGQLWATGRYQIIPSTLKGLQKSLNLPDSTKYNKQTQDKMGLKLLLERSPIKNYILGIVPDTKQNLESASLSVAKVWSSVGVPYATKGSKRQVQKNESYYSGGGDKASIKTEDVQQALKNLRANKDSLSNIESDEEKPSKDKNNTRKIIGIGLSIITIGVTGTLIYLYLKKNNKLPNFIKNIKIKKE